MNSVKLLLILFSGALVLVAAAFLGLRFGSSSEVSAITPTSEIASENLSGPDEMLPSYSTRYDPESNAFDDGRDALKLAKDTNRRVLVEVGGSWCVWCKRFDQVIEENPDFRKILNDNFVVLKINVSDANENEEFLKIFPGINGYPHFFVSESDGTLLHSTDATGWIEDHELSVTKLTRFVQQWAANNESDEPEPEQG